jgi:hypothetical protein
MGGERDQRMGAPSHSNPNPVKGECLAHIRIRRVNVRRGRWGGATTFRATMRGRTSGLESEGALWGLFSDGSGWAPGRL